MTVDGFGGLTCESCRNNSTVTRIGRVWDAILVTNDGLGALMCKTCAQSHRSGLGIGWVGGIPLKGGGGRLSANREPGSYMNPLGWMLDRGFSVGRGDW